MIRVSSRFFDFLLFLMTVKRKWLFSIETFFAPWGGFSIIFDAPEFDFVSLEPLGLDFGSLGLLGLISEAPQKEQEGLHSGCRNHRNLKRLRRHRKDRDRQGC